MKSKSRKRTTRGIELPCPYCGEFSELTVDQGGGDSQTYVEDCPVCCRPRVVTVELSADRDPIVRLDRS